MLFYFFEAVLAIMKEPFIFTSTTGYLNDQMKHYEISLTLKLTNQLLPQSTLPRISDSISEATQKPTQAVSKNKKPNLTKSRELNFYYRSNYDI